MRHFGKNLRHDERYKDIEEYSFGHWVITWGITEYKLEHQETLWDCLENKLPAIWKTILGPCVLYEKHGRHTTGLCTFICMSKCRSLLMLCSERSKSTFLVIRTIYRFSLVFTSERIHRS